MSNAGRIVLTAVAAFAGGVASGLLLAPQSGKQSRSLIARRAREQARAVELRLHEIEQQLAAVEQQMVDAAQGFQGRVSEATTRAVDQVLPGLEDEADWSPDPDEVTRDLRRMPGS